MLHCNLMQVLTPADDIHHINKHNFKVPFVCGCRDLGEALRRIAEGAAMIRTKGEAGTGNVVEAVRHTRSVTGAIRQLQTLDDDELYVYAKEIRAPVDLVRKTKHLGRSVQEHGLCLYPCCVQHASMWRQLHADKLTSCMSQRSLSALIAHCISAAVFDAGIHTMQACCQVGQSMRVAVADTSRYAAGCQLSTLLLAVWRHQQMQP